MLPQSQLALSDLLAITINTSRSSSVTNGPRPDRLIKFLLALNAAKALENPNLPPQDYILAIAALNNYRYGY